MLATWVAGALLLGLLARFVGLPPLVGFLSAGFERTEPTCKVPGPMRCVSRLPADTIAPPKRSSKQASTSTGPATSAMTCPCSTH